MATEDRWTRPSAWCPRPAYWHSEDDDATEQEVSVLVHGFIRALQPEVVVETGTNTGQTAKAINDALVLNGHGHLWTLEIKDSLASSAEALLGGPGCATTVVRQHSLSWMPPGLIDFAWIDTGPTTDVRGPERDSEPNLRRDEIARWLPKFTSGAVIGVHDTAPHHAIMGTLLPLFRQHGIMFLNLRTPRGVLFAQVP